MDNPRAHLIRVILLLSFLQVGNVCAQSWHLIAPMVAARAEPACVKLQSGQILIVGGKDGNGALSSCEIYNPLTDQWKSTGSLKQARFRCPVLLLDDGRVLAIGGLTDLNVATTATCELYDPKTGTWKFTSSLPSPDENASALKLPDGKVFVVAGLNANVPVYLKFALLFDPSTEVFSVLPDMSMALDGVLIYYSAAKDAAMVCGGVFGGFNGFYPRTTQIFSFSTNSWSLADSTIEPRDNGQQNVIQMPDGKPLLVSGRTGPNQTTSNIEAFDWSTLKWSHVGQMQQSHWHCITLRVGQDSIIMIGGSTPTFSNVSAQTTWYKYSTGSSWAGPDMTTGREEYCGLVDALSDIENPCKSSINIYIFGGQDPTGSAVASCEALNLGLKSSATAAMVTQTVGVVGVSCVDTSGSIQINSGACDSLTIDSIRFVGSAAMQVQLANPGSIGIHAGDSTTLSFTVRADSPGNDTGVLMVFGHHKSGLDTLSSIVSFSRSIPPATLSTTSISSVGTVCQAATATMMMCNPGCDSAVVDSVRFDGAGGKRFVATAPATLHSQDSSSITITLPADSAGVYASTARVYYHIGPQHDTLSAGVIFTIGGASAGIAQAVINDITDARPGDTITVPLHIAGGNNTQAIGFTLHAEYNTDLLQMLPPDYSNSLSAGTPFQDINQTSRGADLFVPSTISVNTGTLVNLRFITYLTDSECTEVHLRSLIFSPNDPKFTACVLSTNLDSAEICVHAACGDAAFRALWAGQMPQLNSIQASNGNLVVDFSGAPSARLDLYDVMGRLADVSHSLKPGLASLDISSLQSGVYFARVVSGGSVLSRRVVIGR